MTIARAVALVLALAGLIAATACSGAASAPAHPAHPAHPASPPHPASSASPASFPASPAGTQARWLINAAAHLPIPASAVTAHFDQTFLAQVPPSQLNAVLEQAGSLRLDSITPSTPDALAMTVTAHGRSQFSVTFAVDSRGLISTLLFRPAGTAAATPPVPTSWAAVDSQIRSTAPGVRLLVARVNGTTCQPIHAIDPATQAPLGSAFKLYVLDALAQAVKAGKVSWNQQLTVTSQHKSLPSGELRSDPDGTRISVRQAAENMISISDNTAADMLITLLGRPAVEAAASDSGMADPGRDVPFLTTRELFVLKLDDWPRLADRYLALGPSGRQGMLTSTVDQVPYSTLKTLGANAWTAPRDINSLEWVASPTDICRVYAALRALAGQPGLSPVSSILQINNGGLGLDPSQWRSVWYKGGSEPGVVTLNYLATTRGGQSYVVSVLTENPTAPIPQTSAVPTLISAVKGALELAAR